jgi:hypothetical protein
VGRGEVEPPRICAVEGSAYFSRCPPIVCEHGQEAPTAPPKDRGRPFLQSGAACPLRGARSSSTGVDNPSRPRLIQQQGESYYYSLPPRFPEISRDRFRCYGACGDATGMAPSSLCKQPMERPVAQLDDLSRSRAVRKQDAPLIAVRGLSDLHGIVPCPMRPGSPIGARQLHGACEWWVAKHVCRYESSA